MPPYRRLTLPRHAAGLVGLALCAAFPGAARAELQICNRSFDVVNVAVGFDGRVDFVSEGWWTIGSNQCATILSEPLETRYIYVHATDAFARSVFEGSTPFCIAPAKFEILGTGDCWLRGYIEAYFEEIDTRDADRWTVFIEPAGAVE